MKHNRDAAGGQAPVTVIGLGLMGHLIHESESLGANAEPPRFIKALADQAVADGHAPSSYAAMVEPFRMPAGVRP